MPEITILNKSITIIANPVVTLFNNFALNKVTVQSKCGGKGNCGLCRAKVLKGKQFMSPPNEKELGVLEESDIKNGIRLTCQSYAAQSLEIVLPNSPEEVEQLDKLSAPFCSNNNNNNPT